MKAILGSLLCLVLFASQCLPQRRATLPGRDYCHDRHICGDYDTGSGPVAKHELGSRFLSVVVSQTGLGYRHDDYVSKPARPTPEPSKV